MNEAISRRKLLFFAGLGASIAFPASTLLTASVAEAQQNEQTGSRRCGPEKEDQKEKVERNQHCTSKTEGTVIAWERSYSGL